MKSLLFKSAWNICKTNNVSFSEALKQAWTNAKQGLKAVIVKCNKLVKSAGLGYETIYFNEVVLVNIITKVQVYNSDGARHYYDGKTFNND
jgi:hypothetical protein